jgi:hypothetical protein
MSLGLTTAVAPGSMGNDSRLCRKHMPAAQKGNRGAAAILAVKRTLFENCERFIPAGGA